MLVAYETGEGHKCPTVGLHSNLIQDPIREVEKVSQFLYSSIDVDAAIEAVDSSLYRNR